MRLRPRRLAAGRAVAVPLVVADQPDPADVPLFAAERGAQELQHQLGGLVHAVLAGTDGDDVRVVVLTGELRGRGVPDQRGADAGHLVGRDLLAVARPADDHAEAARLDDHPLADLEAERRVVVLRVVGERAAVDRRVPGAGERAAKRRRAGAKPRRAGCAKMQKPNSGTAARKHK